MRAADALTMVAWLALTAVATAHDASHGSDVSSGDGMHHGHHPSQPSPTDVRVSDEMLPETRAQLLDQDGAERGFRELLGEGPFVVAFFYANCGQQCPVSDLVMDGVAAETADDDRTRLVSLTLDPERDRVGVLREKHEMFGERPHWSWATGQPAEIHRLLQLLGAETGPLNEHDAMFLVGNASEGRMTRVIGLAEPESLLALLDRYGR